MDLKMIKRVNLQKHCDEDTFKSCIRDVLPLDYAAAANYLYNNVELDTMDMKNKNRQHNEIRKKKIKRSRI